MKELSRGSKSITLSLVLLYFSLPVKAQTFDYADGPVILGAVIILALIIIFIAFQLSGKKIELPPLQNYLKRELKITVKNIESEFVITIYNQSKKTQEIYVPTLYLTRGRALKKLQPRDKYTTYPLSLMPNTFHRFRIEPKRLKKQAPELKKIWYFTVVIYTAEGKKIVSKEHRFR